MPEQNMCNGVKPGDTIKMYWVHTSCDTAPGPGLGSCLSEKCAKLDINSLNQWCENNPFNESKAHGIRELVTNPALLSEIAD